MGQAVLGEQRLGRPGRSARPRATAVAEARVHGDQSVEAAQVERDHAAVAVPARRPAHRRPRCRRRTAPPRPGPACTSGARRRTSSWRRRAETTASGASPRRPPASSAGPGSTCRGCAAPGVSSVGMHVARSRPGPQCREGASVSRTAGSRDVGQRDGRSSGSDREGQLDRPRASSERGAACCRVAPARPVHPARRGDGTLACRRRRHCVTV